MLANPKIAFVGSPREVAIDLGQREERPVGEAVAVDQEELVGRPSAPIIGTARHASRGGNPRTNVESARKYD